MKVKFVSDFHTEFWECNSEGKFKRILEKYLPPREDDAEVVLCCAGDMGTYKHYGSTYKWLLKLLSKRFKHVVMVPGNHSWYRSVGTWDREADFWFDKVVPKNVSYLDNGYVIIDGVAFIGSCLWTSLDNADPVAVYHCHKGMNDYQSIRTGYRAIEGCYMVSNTLGLTPEATMKRHADSVAFITEALSLFRDRTCVVVTHHAPSYMSVSPMYRGDALNHAFANNLGELITHYRPKIWHHGHMHHTDIYHIGDTEVICNSLGYHPRGLSKEFDPDFISEVE